MKRNETISFLQGEFWVFSS